MNLSISKRYAKALMKVALKEEKIEQFKEELNRFSNFIQESKILRESLNHIHIKQSDKVAIINTIFEKDALHQSMQNFIKLLIIKNRFSLLSSINLLFEDMVNVNLNIEKGHITSSLDMEDADKTKLEETLEQKLKKKVDLSYSQDPSLISGIIAQIGSVEVNASVSNQLNLLYNKILDN